MKKSVFLLVPIAIMAIAACSQVEPESAQTTGGKKMVFTSSIGAYTKVTGNHFDTGDQAVLSIGSPVNASKVVLTYANGSFTPSQALYWALNQADDLKTDFWACYPYSPDVDPGQPFTFDLKRDQRPTGAYAACDLLVAKTQAAPADDVIHLGFSHALSRLVITVDNKIQNMPILAAALIGAKLSVSVNIPEDSYTATGDVVTEDSGMSGIVFASKIGDNKYAFMLPPQTAPDLKVGLLTSQDDGVVFTPANTLTFTSGKQISATLTLEQSGLSFGDASITDWIDEYADFGMEGGSNEPGEVRSWKLIAINSSEDQAEMIPMEEQEDGGFMASVPAPESGKVYIAIGTADFDIETGDGVGVGCAIPDYEATISYFSAPVEAPTSYIEPGSFTVNTAEPFDVVFYPNRSKVVFMPSPSQWENIGKGLFLDGFMTDLFGLPHTEWEVDIEEDALRPGLYRIPEPYENWAYREYAEEDEVITFNGGGELIFDVRKPRQSYILESYSGFNCFYNDADNELYLMSKVPENGWYSLDYYSDFYEQYNWLNCYTPVSIYMYGIGGWTGNKSGMMSITLPGGQRMQRYTSFKHEKKDSEVGEDGTNYAVFDVTPALDIYTVRYAVASGIISREEIMSTYLPMVQNNTEGSVTVEELVPDAVNTIKIPFQQSGTYTILFYYEYEGTDGPRWNGSYYYYAELKEGDTAPEAGLSLSLAEDQGAMPESSITFHLDVKSPRYIYYLAMTADMFEESGLTDDDIYDYVMDNGTGISIYGFNDAIGADVTVSGLEADTEYVILAAAETLYGISAWDYLTAKTEKPAVFLDYGLGHYTDVWFFGNDCYRMPVTILKKEDADVFRVLTPYASFWTPENIADYGDSYNGQEADHFDFYLEDDEFIYSSFWNGYTEVGYGIAEYQYKPGYLNQKITDGVYNLSPYIQLLGTTYYYPATDAWEQIFLEMPGVDYTPSWKQSGDDAAAGAPARAKSAGKSYRPSPLLDSTPARARVQTQVKPFTRHFIKTGQPVVIPAAVKASIDTENSLETVK